MVNILFVQRGNYAEAYLRFQEGKPETYRDQRAMVGFVEDLSRTHNVTVFAACDQRHDMQLSPSLRSIGVPFSEIGQETVRSFFRENRIDRLICKNPAWRFLAQAKRDGIPTLPQFADLFQVKKARDVYKYTRLRLTLASRTIPCVSNHSLNASKSVASTLRYPMHKVVPWDRRPVPAYEHPKEGVVDPSAPRIFFGGALSVEKGVEDCLAAIKVLEKAGIRARFSFASKNDPEPWRQRAAELGVQDQVDFLGLIPNEQVLSEMRAHDIVVVPTRREYAEGLPNTLREALATRSALVVSDHPAFAGRLRAEEDCLVFKGGDPADLANAIQRLCDSNALYANLSGNAPVAQEKLPFGLFWDQLYTLFIEDPTNETGWVDKHSLAVLLGKST